MTAVGVLFLAVFVTLLVVGPFVLYMLIRSETETDRMDREAAERAARQDSADDERDGW